MRVVVAMSGGVDSSVAAGLMLEAGHEVIGLTMKLRDTTPDEMVGKSASCCSPDDMRDARQVCDGLGIPHYVIDYREMFQEKVVSPFVESYLNGQTPNPCVLCNDHIKFEPLLKRMRALGAERLVTGHYARITEDEQGLFNLSRGRDEAKDQSYFLFGLGQEILSQTWFPLGDLAKEDVREHAKRMGIATWDKPDSEDICFVPGGDYKKVVEKQVGADALPDAGPILHEDGSVLGQHEGIHRYTVGQRKGLSVASNERLYVLNVRPEDATVVVGPRTSLAMTGLRAERCVWTAGVPPAQSFRADVRIRYRHTGTDGEVVTVGEEAVVRFDTPQLAVTPGQAVVFYHEGTVIGGGWISKGMAPVEIEGGSGV